MRGESDFMMITEPLFERVSCVNYDVTVSSNCDSSLGLVVHAAAATPTVPLSERYGIANPYSLSCSLLSLRWETGHTLIEAPSDVPRTWARTSGAKFEILSHIHLPTGNAYSRSIDWRKKRVDSLMHQSCAVWASYTGVVALDRRLNHWPVAGARV